MLYTKKELADRIKAMHDVMADIGEHFYDAGNGINEKYPFHKSFDEVRYDVLEWKKAVENMRDFYGEDIAIEVMRSANQETWHSEGKIRVKKTAFSLPRYFILNTTAYPNLPKSMNDVYCFQGDDVIWQDYIDSMYMSYGEEGYNWEQVLVMFAYSNKDYARLDKEEEMTIAQLIDAWEEKQGQALACTSDEIEHGKTEIFELQIPERMILNAVEDLRR